VDIGYLSRFETDLGNIPTAIKLMAKIIPLVVVDIL